MVYVRYVLDPQYSGFVIAREGDFLRVRWDDGRIMQHHKSEIEADPNKTKYQSE